MKIFLDPNAPNTNCILGAALSGGDHIALAKMFKPMPRTLDIIFRGDDITIVVDQYEADPDTNALDVSWHFKYITPEQTDALKITDDEEASIIEQIGEFIADRSEPDEYDYKNDR